MWSDIRAPIGLGCMRLSTDDERDDERGVAVLHAAFDAGITFLDTADAYCRDEHETGHNERLIARAIASWPGDRSRLIVASKGGLTRPGGRWVPDGRARHLMAACEASLRALGARPALYQLHAIDPRTPLSTSVRALAQLQRDGRIDRIGLCNVTVQQIEEARRVADIAAVQVEISPWNDDNILSGVAAYCIANRIQLLAYRPLGGTRRVRRTLADPVLTAIGARHGATAAEIALAWLADLSPALISLPGPTRVDTARSVGAASAIRLTDDDRAALDARFSAAAALRRARAGVKAPNTGAGDGEVVLILGLPGAGKSTLAATFVDRGYQRLNRDGAGGSLRGLAGAIAGLARSGTRRIVVDNTYASRKSRAPVIQAAAEAGLSVRCVWATTGLEDAQVNAVWRIWSTYGRVLTPDEMRAEARHDINAFGPGVQFRYVRELEPPTEAEGFAEIELVPFVRKREPNAANRAVLVWCDGVLARSRAGHRTPLTPDDVEIVEPVAHIVRAHAAAGARLLGIAWRPELADGSATVEQIEATMTRIRDGVGADIEIRYCPHAAGPPVCWCRKPLPGLGVDFIRRYDLDPAKCLYVGAGAQDAAFARRLGFAFQEADRDRVST